ncbi:uncharacterized protein LOC134300980 [Trichomycterus rosablanca]|uniref:uncharacterized protein LOC134300980 n=1 Tax=Trichomycterus rosablanca TaxID=2290929 RepID=UPI002F35C62A
MGNEHFEKDIQEPLDIEDDGVNTEDDLVNASSSEVDNENSTTSLMGTDIQENNIEDDMSNASNSEDDDGAVDNENSSTSSLFGADIQEYEEDLSDSEGSMLHATRSEAGNDGDSENMMEDNTGGGSTSEFSVDNEDRADAGDKPLYPGAHLSKGESILMLMSYLLRHNLTGEAFTHLLEMFNIMFPGLIPSSYYLFHKEFGSSSKFEVHFYCESCSKYLGIRAECPFQCDSCNTVFDASANLKNGFYFLVLPLYAQIQQLLQEHSVSLNEKTRTSGVLSDIQSGEEYQKLHDSGVLGKDDLTLIWNCDGAPVFKSSKCSIWPIQCQVIELKPEVRKKHILMSALWFGPSKPSMLTLLTPFVKEASLLETAGIEWQDIQGNCHVSKVFVLVCSSDSMARPLLRNTKQFNGFYGCDFCYHKGGKSYPYDRPEPPLRNERDHFSHAMSASDNEPVFGVKGPSPLMKLCHFQMINGFIPEYQHNVCLGVTRQLSTLWFDTANSEAAWYIGKQIKEVDLRLVKIKPPVEITRTPRSMSERKFWKASEWRAFLLFYALPVLKGILPARFWNHLFLLVFGIYTLLQDKIKTRSVLMSELALKKFVIEFQRLYGKHHMTFNIHLLTHVTQIGRGL